MSQVGPTAQYHNRTPPINGVFPLDREGECKDKVFSYLECLKIHKYEMTPCQDLAKVYFECRLKNELLTERDWQIFGFSNNNKETE